MAVELVGADALVRALETMSLRVQEVTPEAIVTAQGMIAGEARTDLSRYSHARGTPTPAPPGGPPAKITGRLRGSFDLAGPTPAGAGVWMSVMGPTAPYARIQELGGATGRGGATVLPARPYFIPAAERVLRGGHIAELFNRAWAEAITS